MTCLEQGSICLECHDSNLVEEESGQVICHSCGLTHDVVHTTSTSELSTLLENLSLVNLPSLISELLEADKENLLSHLSKMTLKSKKIRRKKRYSPYKKPPPPKLGGSPS
jgi:recombinational DNA repair protein (RecF pathway)